MIKVVRAAGVKDPVAVEQITYLMALMLIPADNDPAAFAGPDDEN
jgi:hypothetical protein